MLVEAWLSSEILEEGSDSHTSLKIVVHRKVVQAVVRSLTRSNWKLSHWQAGKQAGSGSIVNSFELESKRSGSSSGSGSSGGGKAGSNSIVNSFELKPKISGRKSRGFTETVVRRVKVMQRVKAIQ